ncbi:MAG: hypothetical protein LBM93_11675 [Oscillospiraceae bacterium]|jgi:hypothetical protein|nr:hypothetical protein [Oscillospiraceae bacterium]
MWYISEIDYFDKQGDICYRIEDTKSGEDRFCVSEEKAKAVIAEIGEVEGYIEGELIPLAIKGKHETDQDNATKRDLMYLGRCVANYGNHYLKYSKYGLLRTVGKDSIILYYIDKYGVLRQGKIREFDKNEGWYTLFDNPTEKIYLSETFYVYSGYIYPLQRVLVRSGVRYKCLRESKIVQLTVDDLFELEIATGFYSAEYGYFYQKQQSGYDEELRFMEIKSLDGSWIYDKKHYMLWNKRSFKEETEVETAKRALLGLGEYTLRDNGDLGTLKPGRNGVAEVPSGCKNICDCSIDLEGLYTLKVGSNVKKCSKKCYCKSSEREETALTLIFKDTQSNVVTNILLQEYTEYWKMDIYGGVRTPLIKVESGLANVLKGILFSTIDSCGTSFESIQMYIRKQILNGAYWLCEGLTGEMLEEILEDCFKKCFDKWVKINDKTKLKQFGSKYSYFYRTVCMFLCDEFEKLTVERKVYWASNLKHLGDNVFNSEKQYSWEYVLNNSYYGIDTSVRWRR